MLVNRSQLPWSTTVEGNFLAGAGLLLAMGLIVGSDVVRRAIGEGFGGYVPRRMLPDEK